MADHEYIGTKRPAVSTKEYGPCKFYASGQCKFGATCLFSHIKTSTSSKVSVPCQFFAKGNCAEGDKCRFLHINRRPFDQDHDEVPDNSKEIVCKYHSSFRGCRAGSDCPFLHPLKQDEPIYLPSSSSTGAGAKILEKYSMARTAEQQGVEAIIRSSNKP